MLVIFSTKVEIGPKIADAIIGYKKDFYGENSSNEAPIKKEVKEIPKPVKQVVISTPEKLPVAQPVKIETINNNPIDSTSNQMNRNEKIVVSDSNQVIFKVL